MKKRLLIFFLGFTLSLLAITASAQCSICTRTAAQMGEKPAKGLNLGILYLAAIPYIMVGVISYRWYKKNGSQPAEEKNA
jgi:hypothetical protein